MGKNIIGIDISDFSIEALSLEKERKGFKLEAYSRFRLSPDIVEDGRIMDKDKLKDALLRMFKNAQPQAFDKSRKVFLSVPESQTFSRVLTVPKNVKDKELVKATINKAEEVIPESINRLTSIVKILPEIDGNKQALYVAAETDVLQDFVLVFKELGMEVEGITSETVSSFYGLKKEKDKKNTLLLDLGAKTTIASIFSDNCLCSSINIDIGGDNITNAIAQKLNISHDEAEKKKVENGLTSNESGEIMLISQGQLQPLVDELKVFVKYWQDTTNLKVERVVLIGGLSQMKGADKYFGDNLNLETKIGEPFIDIKSFPQDLNYSKYINVLGLARISHQGTDIDFYKKLEKDYSKHKESDNKEVVKEKHKFNIGEFFGKIFKNKYFWIVLGLLLLSGLGYLFKDKIWEYKNKFFPEPPPMAVEENIVVSTRNIEGIDNFILGEVFNFQALKVYNAQEDETLPEDYVDNFANTIKRLEAEGEYKIVPFIETQSTDDEYIIPVVMSYKLLNTDPTAEDYEAGQTINANIEYTFISFSPADVKDLVVKKYPKLQGKINSLKYDILEYPSAEKGVYFEILVLVNE